MEFKLIINAPVLKDIEEILEWYSSSGELVSQKFLQQLRLNFQNLQKHAENYRYFDSTLRILPLKNFLITFII